MTTIKGTTKKGATMINNARNYEGYSLREIYGNFSQAKESAWEYCRNLCYKEGGENFRIFSHNTFGFSVAWDVENGVRIETPQNSYLVTI